MGFVCLCGGGGDGGGVDGSNGVVVVLRVVLGIVFW